MGEIDQPEIVPVWEPNEKQAALLSCPVFEVLFGGARGGGKTDGMLGDFAQHAQQYAAGAIGIALRRTREQLREMIERSTQLYRPIGATWREQKKEWTFPNGARLKFAYLDNDADAENYQGHAYSRLYLEELTNFPSPAPVMKLMATLRSGAGVPVGFRATANPGGPGHAWVKARYIDPAPGGWKVIKDPETGLERVFIPSRLVDNSALMQGDPLYSSRLRQSGSEELVKAWLNGNWDVIAGAYFDEWDPARHVVKPFEIPKHWPRFRAADWGSAAPFAVYWFAICPDTHIATNSAGEHVVIPRGALVTYREWYGAREERGAYVGLKMTADQVGAGIVKRDAGEAIKYGVLDPAAFAEDGGPSIAERMGRAGARFRPADNARVGRNGAMGGWDQLRARLRGSEDGPEIVFFETCVHAIRTVPVMQHDEKNAEDVDTKTEDHAADAIRYGCMSRPVVRKVRAPEKKNPFLAKNAFAPRANKKRARL